MYPAIPSIINITFTLKQKATLNLILPIVFLAKSTSKLILDNLSSSNTMSAVSIATSAPSRPIAIPTFARAREGVSFTPSPTIATS